MKLEDTVQIITATAVRDDLGNVDYDWTSPTVVATLPAHVGYKTVGVTSDSIATLVEQLEVMIEPFAYDATVQRILWRDRMHVSAGPAKIHRQHGEDHHLTIPIRIYT